MLEATKGARAAVASAVVGSLLAGVAAVALPLLPSSHSAASQVVSAAGASATPNPFEPTDDFTATLVEDAPAIALEAAPMVEKTVAVAAPRRAAAAKKPAAKPAVKSTAKAAPKSAAKPAVNVVIPSGPIVGKLNSADIEGYPRYEAQSTCDPTDKPGAVALRTLLLGYYKGTSNFGISRACGSDRSEHYEGRAFDWGANVNNASQRAAVENFAAQLMATDAFGHKQALARRLGVMYIIWNGQIWSPGQDSTWRPYTGSNPHTDHMHISLTWAGARAETSFWSGTVVPGLPGDEVTTVRPPRTTTTTRSPRTTTTTRPPRTTTTTRPPRTTSTTVRPTTTTVRSTTTTAPATTSTTSAGWG